MRSRLRMWQSLAALHLRQNWSVILGGVLTVEGVFSLFFPIVAAVSGVLGGLAALLFVRDSRAVAEERRDLRVERADFNPARAKVSATYGGAVVTRVRDQVFQLDDDVDALLRANATPVSFSRIPHELPLQIRNVVPAVVRHQREAGHLVFNAKVLRLDTDVIASNISPGGSVSLRPAYYFDVLATDYLTNYVVRSVRQRREVLTGAELLTSRAGYIRDLSHSWSANAIGISTIAFTTDGVIVLPHQTGSNVSEGDRRSPSGSGSAEPRDITTGVVPDTLQALLGRAMERELREECNLPASVDMHTKVLGFARWIDHGAKPEFFGVTMLSVAERDIVDLQVAKNERMLVGSFHTWRPDIEAIAAAEGGLRRISGLLGPSASAPLLLAVRALSLALRDDPHLLDELRAQVRSA